MNKLEQIRAVATKAFTGSGTDESAICQILEILGPIDRSEPPIGERPTHALTIRQYAELCFASRGVDDWKAKANAMVDGWEGKPDYATGKLRYYWSPDRPYIIATRGHAKQQWEMRNGDRVWRKLVTVDDYPAEKYREEGWVEFNPHPEGKVPE